MLEVRSNGLPRLLLDRGESGFGRWIPYPEPLMRIHTAEVPLTRQFFSIAAISVKNTTGQRRKKDCKFGKNWQPAWQQHQRMPTFRITPEEALFMYSLHGQNPSVYINPDK